MNCLGVCRWSACIHVLFALCCGQTGRVSHRKLLTILVVYQFVLKAVVGSRCHGVMQITLWSPDENILDLK